MPKDPRSCPFCGKRVKQRNDVIFCGHCHYPVHVQCVDLIYCVCFRCLEKLGTSLKDIKIDPAMKTLILRKRKSLGL